MVPPSDIPELRAQEAERQAQRRVVKAQERAKAEEKEIANRSEQIKDEYVKSAEAEAIRGEAQIIAQKNEGYATIREMTRLQENEAKRIKREGERDLQTLNDYYRDTLYKTERKNSEEVDQLRRRHATEVGYQQRLTASDSDLAKAEHVRLTNLLREEQEAQLKNLNEQNKTSFETKREQTVNAIAQAQERFDQKFTDTLKNQGKILGDVESAAAKQLEDIRASTSTGIDAYSSRQSDPFYKMVTLDAQLSEHDDAFILTANIPKHEQKGVSVSVRGNEVVVAGYRRNEEKLDLAPGRNQRTASYQSYSESFPVNYPIDARGVSRTFDGDTLIVRFPKKTTYSVAPNRTASKPPKAKATRPDFPENLPVTQSELTKASTPELEPGAEKDTNRTGSRGRVNRTLG